MVPVTPTQTLQHIHVLLPIHDIIQPNPPMLTRVSLLQRLTTPREPWEEHLWNKIRPHAHIDTLCAQLLKKTCFFSVISRSLKLLGRPTLVLGWTQVFEYSWLVFIIEGDFCWSRALVSITKVAISSLRSFISEGISG